ncbi:hypothetical protein KEJ19_03560, partial [Candidatus Bathyarchaeota archaeon]|nr:hypothetical protein [Candidatus Bathyarchaeota archaeon]
MTSAMGSLGLVGKRKVRLWIHRLEALVYHGPPRPRSPLAIDGTKIKIKIKLQSRWLPMDAIWNPRRFWHLCLLYRS